MNSQRKQLEQAFQMRLEDTLKAALLNEFKLPDDAVAYLMDLWHVSQIFDDYADGDAVSIEDRDKAVFLALAGIPSNPFFDAHRHQLTTAQAMAVLKWMASDKMERGGMANELSYAWRGGFYDVLCLVMCLVHGISADNALKALIQYGETYESYKKEFG